MLDDIIVTATKRPTPRRDVPASIVALDGGELERAGSFDASDFLRRVPGVELTEIMPDLTRVSIRGIQLDAGANTPEATGIFIDDIPLNDPFLDQARPDLATFDLDGIEILKGPQGTLFGGSGMAGAIRYKLADAELAQWVLKSFGQFQDVSEGSPRRLGGVATNIPLGDDAAMRLTATRRNSGGVIDDVRNGVADTDSSTSTGGRGVLRWEAGDALTVRVKAVQQEGKTNDPPLAENTEGRLERQRALRPSSPSETRFGVYGLDVDWRTSAGTLTTLASAIRKRSYYQVAYAERTLGTEDSGQPADSPVRAHVDGYLLESRLASPDDAGAAWQWLAGVFAHDYKTLTTQHLFTRDGTTGQETPLLDFVADVRARESAVFGELGARLANRWKGSLGVRAYQTRTEGTVVSTGAVILATGSAENRNDASQHASGINPKATLQFQWSKEASLYVAAARGFRFGGIQIVGPSPGSPDIPPTYKSDSLWSYEGGVRTQWFDNTLQVDGALFYVDWKDPQVNTISKGAVPLNVIDNVDKARSQGAELALRYVPPIDGLEADLTAAYTDARTTRDFAGPGGAVVTAGSRLPGYASYQVAGVLRYLITVGPIAATSSLSYVQQGPGVSDILQSIRIYDYASTDARVALRDAAHPQWPSLAVGVTNLTDERAVVSALVINSGNYTTIYNRPRTFDVRLELAF